MKPLAILMPLALFACEFPQQENSRLDYENCKIELAHSQQQWEMFRKERDECLKTEVCPLCNKRHNERSMVR